MKGPVKEWDIAKKSRNCSQNETEIKFMGVFIFSKGDEVWKCYQFITFNESRSAI